MKLGKIMAKEIAEIPEIYSKGNLFLQKLQPVMHALRSGEISNVLIIARGSSDNAAHYLKFLIEYQLGLPVSLASPSLVSIYKAPLHLEQTLVIAISQSGKSPDLLNYLIEAKKSSPLSISFTNDDSSPMAKAADFHINIGAGPELAVASSKSYAAQMFASFIFVMAWVKGDPQLELIASLAPSMLEVEIARVVKAFQLSRQVVIIGRGSSYGNSKDMGLKLQETSHVAVQSWSSADYLHGPISAMAPDAQVIIIAPHGAPDNLLGDLLPRLYTSNVELFWIGQGVKPSRGLMVGGSLAGNEMISSLLDAILIQRFAHNISVHNGFNPDAPVGLTKVTLTH